MYRQIVRFYIDRNHSHNKFLELPHRLNNLLVKPSSSRIEFSGQGVHFVPIIRELSGHTTLQTPS